MSSTDDMLGEKTPGAVNESGPESAEQEIRSADLDGASALKSPDAPVPEKSPEAPLGGEPLVSPMILGGDHFSPARALAL